MKTEQKYTPEQASRAATFTAATKGLHPWRIAKAFNAMRPGHDFRGCPKRWLRDQFACGDMAKFSGHDLRAALAKVGVTQ